MLKSIYQSYDELPLFLNAEQIAGILGVSASVAYTLIHSKDFPSLQIGGRYVVPKDKFILWVERNFTNW